MTIRDAVIACVRMGMDMRVIAKAYKLPFAKVETIAWLEFKRREAIQKPRRRRS